MKKRRRRRRSSRRGRLRERSKRNERHRSALLTAESVVRVRDTMRVVLFTDRAPGSFEVTWYGNKQLPFNITLSLNGVQTTSGILVLSTPISQVMAKEEVLFIQQHIKTKHNF